MSLTYESLQYCTVQLKLAKKFADMVGRERSGSGLYRAFVYTVPQHSTVPTYCVLYRAVVAEKTRNFSNKIPASVRPDVNQLKLNLQYDSLISGRSLQSLIESSRTFQGMHDRGELDVSTTSFLLPPVVHHLFPLQYSLDFYSTRTHKPYMLPLLLPTF